MFFLAYFLHLLYIELSRLQGVGFFHSQSSQSGKLIFFYHACFYVSAAVFVLI